MQYSEFLDRLQNEAANITFASIPFSARREPNDIYDRAQRLPIRIGMFVSVDIRLSGEGERGIGSRCDCNQFG